MENKFDTEAVLVAFSEWGNSFIHKLNGMFAIAIYDKLEDKLTLIRDRIGIKPLFYYHKNDKLIFASEIKAFKATDVKLTIDYQSIYSYLHLGYIPKTNSIFKEIKKVHPGSIIEFKNRILKEINYWNSKNHLKKEQNSSFDKSKKQLDSLLNDSIQKRLMSDVPIGTFLSGGTDSSIVTAIAQKISPNQSILFQLALKKQNIMKVSMLKK